MTTRRGRLRLTVYLSAVVLVFVLGGLFAAFQILEATPTAEIRTMSRTAAERLIQLRSEPATLHAALAAYRPTQLSITLYDADRQLIDASGAPLPARLIDHARERGRLTFVHELRDGSRVIGYAIVEGRPPSLRRLLVGLAALVTALALLVLVIVRHISQPMQALASAADRFGRGDLSARARITRKDELGEVGRAFDQMADRVTLLMSTQRELMANVSHELRTPLARVQVAIDLILDGVDAQAKELLPEVQQDLTEVERLIEDVMTMARFDLAQAEGLAAGAPLRREPVAVAALIDRAETRFRSLHAARALIVTRDADLPTLALDPALMVRVLENLLENARKYSEPDTAIELDARVTADRLTFTITDHGIGIDAADLPKVFTPFFRSDRSRNRATGGAGLGLGLARRIVLAHDGSIELTSEPQRGTRVVVSVPVDEPAGRAG